MRVVPTTGCLPRRTVMSSAGEESERALPAWVTPTPTPALVLKVSQSSRSTLLRSVADAERLLPGLSNRREAALAAVEGGTPCWEGEALNVPGGYTWWIFCCVGPCA